MAVMVLNKDLFFQTMFYTVEDIINGVCSDEILTVVKRFTKDIVTDIRESRGDGANAFRLTFEGFKYHDMAEVRLELYSVSADINYGLEAKLIVEYGAQDIILDDVQKVFWSIELPNVSAVTKEICGFITEEKEYIEEYEEIEYAREYEPLDCECYHDECTHEPRWSYDYTRPIAVEMKERKYTEKYLVLDLIEEDDDE